MNDRSRLAWLYRRVGFGLAPGQLDAATGAGLDATLSALVDPDAAGVAPAPDPWAGIEYGTYDSGAEARQLVVRSITAWVAAMATTPRPLEEWMRWFWHGHLVSTIRVVKYPQLMVQQMRLFGELGLGDFRTLLRAVTVDPAMLIYLDGTTSRRGAVNENYGREVLELFALGIGNYAETDVRAGAEALTGWVAQRRAGTVTGEAIFDPRRHDDSPKDFLGRSGVHDVDTVIDAIVAHPACAPFITGKLARAILGPEVDPALVERLAVDFAASGLQLRPLVRAILEAGVRDDASRPLVQAPVPWLVAMIKASSASADKAINTIGERGLVPSGQVPWDAPNVAGWPGGHAWLSSSSTVARYNIATGVAALAPASSPLRKAAQAGDAAAMADLLGHPDGFSDATRGALAGLRGADATGVAAMSVAMAAPDTVMA